jgi:hypothetical protein
MNAMRKSNGTISLMLTLFPAPERRRLCRRNQVIEVEHPLFEMSGTEELCISDFFAFWNICTYTMRNLGDGT